jgi:hypothetical protein
MKQAKGDKGKCDVLASKIVRSIGYCEKCGEQEYKKLTCSHIVGRRYSATRTDLDNLQCLCYSCHYYFENWPKEFSRWITKTIGIEKYEELKTKAEVPTKMDWTAERKRLQDIYDNLTD